MLPKTDETFIVGTESEIEEIITRITSELITAEQKARKLCLFAHADRECAIHITFSRFRDEDSEQSSENNNETRRLSNAESISFGCSSDGYLDGLLWGANQITGELCKRGDDNQAILTSNIEFLAYSIANRLINCNSSANEDELSANEDELSAGSEETVYESD